MHNYYIQFDKNNKFSGFNIQMLRQEPKLIDEEYTEVIGGVEETKTLKIQAKDSDGNLVFDTIEIGALPENSYVITSEQHSEYLTALNSQLKNVVLVDGKIKIVDKYTQEELAAQKAEQDKVILIGKAQALLNQNDYRQTKAIGGMYSDEKKQAVLEYMEALREVIRQAEQGNLTELPTLEI